MRRIHEYRPCLLHGREIDDRVVGAVERVGEDPQRDRERDFRELRVRVAGFADRHESVVGDRAAHPFRCRLSTKRISALRVGRQAGHLAEQVACGDAEVAPGA